MIFKQTFKNHFVVSSFTWLMTIFLFGAWAYFNYDSNILLIGGMFHLFFTIPAIYLHIEYFIINAGEEIEINNNEIIVRKNKKQRTYNSNDLLKIIVYKSASLDKVGIPFSAMEYYRYARIITKSGEEIIITCLMVLDLEIVVKLLSQVPFERRKSLAFLWWK